MGSIRFSREYKLDISDKMRVKVGTLNRFENKVMYINLKTWITPVNDMDFEKSLDLMKRMIDKRMNKYIKSSVFDNDHILIQDITPTNMKVGYKKWCDITLHIKQPEENIMPIEKTKSYFSTEENFIRTINDIETIIESFDFKIKQSKNEQPN